VTPECTDMFASLLLSSCVKVYDCGRAMPHIIRLVPGDCNVVCLFFLAAGSHIADCNRQRRQVKR